MFSTLMKSYWLRRTERQINHLEKREAELKVSLEYVQQKLLPDARQQRNELLFGKPRATPGWSQQ